MNKEIFFVFKKGREINDSIDKITSSEFYYGLVSMLKQNKPANLFPEENIGIGSNLNLINKFINWISVKIFSIPLYPLLIFFFKKRSFNKKRIYILTTNTQGILFSLAKYLKIIEADIYFIVMGAISDKISKLKLKFLKTILSNTKLIFQSDNEMIYVNKIMPNHKKYFVPFGVNHNFWIKDKDQLNKNYVLSIGNDLSRDHQLLIDSWKAEYPHLIIITKHRLKNLKKNIKIIIGDWKQKILSDYDIRNFYRNSLFVVVALKPNIDASGQSVVLQALSCSKPVIITKTIGFWDNKYFKHGFNILFSKPNDINDLQIQIEKLITKNDLRNKLENNSRQLITKYFSEEIMSSQIYKIINENSN